MDDTEKIMALKKAYAEVILTTSKEAAAQVLVSEKKALSFQQEISSTKEEALNMLLHMKEMMVSKTAEQETIYFRQQRKIEKLEAQLQEAEEIVVDLRQELKQRNDELNEVKSFSTQHVSGTGLDVDASLGKSATNKDQLRNSYEQIVDYPSDSEFNTIINSGPHILSNTIQEYNISNTTGQAGSLGVSDLVGCRKDSSRIMEGKEAKPFTNGCTERFHASKRNCIKGFLTVPGNVDHSNDNDEGKCLVYSRPHGREIMKETVMAKYQKSLRVRTRCKKTCFGKSKLSLYSSRCNLLMKKFQRYTDIRSSKTFPIKGNVKSNKDTHDGGQFINRRKTDQKIRNGIDAFKSFNGSESSPLSPCKTLLANETSIEKLIPPADSGLKFVKSNIDSGSEIVVATCVQQLDKSGVASGADEKQMELTDVSMLVKEKDATSERSVVPTCETNSVMADAAAMNTSHNCANITGEAGQSFKADKNRLLKYTFQRKRKKESMVKSKGRSWSGDKMYKENNVGESR